jgi:kinetochore protein NDC80
MNNQDLLDKIKEAIGDKKAETETLEHRVRAAEDEFEKTKEVSFYSTYRNEHHN